MTDGIGRAYAWHLAAKVRPNWSRTSAKFCNVTNSSYYFIVEPKSSCDGLSAQLRVLQPPKTFSCARVCRIFSQLNCSLYTLSTTLEPLFGFFIEFSYFSVSRVNLFVKVFFKVVAILMEIVILLDLVYCRKWIVVPDCSILHHTKRHTLSLCSYVYILQCKTIVNFSWYVDAGETAADTS